MEILLTQKEGLLERTYLTECMPLLTLSHSFETCGGHDAFTSTTIIEKCGGKISFGGQERYILKIHYELLYPLDEEGRNATSCKLTRSELPYPLDEEGRNATS